MEYIRCTHVREFQALERRAERAELEVQQCRETIGKLQDDLAYMIRQRDELRRWAREALDEAARNAGCQ